MPSDIAIVGIAAELPSGNYSNKNLDHESFFDFLLNKGEAYERLPTDRFNVDTWHGHGPGQIHVKNGAFLKDIDAFDNAEFGISNRDARSMAPATRKLIELSFLALLDSGISYRSENVGCYTSGISHELLNVTEPDLFDAQGSFAGPPSMIANRVSYHLDLLGPSVPTDTACSSTLTALHLAVQALSMGECEAAVVAGCQLNYRFMDWVAYSQGSVLAKDGKCKPFDASADGFSRAEGAVAIVVKPLAAALMDNDFVYATILGTAINSTGNSKPPAAPVGEAQQRVMEKAFNVAQRNPQEVDYVECHATGTSRGDPEEVNWIGQSFRREDELLIGSVKGNIGHTEIVAFLASLSKVISALQRGIIPPNVNLVKRNPAIKWDEYNLRVPVETTPLPCRSGHKHLISMASSGIGGSNGHAVIESFPAACDQSDLGHQIQRPVLLIASGLSSRSASAIAEELANVAIKNIDLLPGMAIELGRRSRQLNWRSFAVIDPQKTEHTGPVFSSPAIIPREKSRLCFVFSGQGPQHSSMGRQLFENFPDFRKSILESDEIYQELTGKSFIKDYGLYGSKRGGIDTMSDPWPIALVLPSITVFQIALFDLLNALGVKPDVVVGHSAGETAVLYASGAGTRAIAIELAVARGRVLSTIEPMGGAMAALSCNSDEAHDIINEAAQLHPQMNVDIACYNSPGAVALSGKELFIDAVLKLARSRDIIGNKLRTRVPFHSSMIDTCKERYLKEVTGIFERHSAAHVPCLQTYSTLTGDRFLTSFDAKYYWNNTRSPVLFGKAIETIIDRDPSTIFVELAPHPVLMPYVAAMTKSPDLVLCPVLRPKRGAQPVEYQSLLKMLGTLTVLGYDSVDFVTLNAGRRSIQARSIMPSYPFTRKSFPLYPNTDGYRKQLMKRNGPLNYKYLAINKDTHKLLAQHTIGGEPIMPAAGFLEMALEFGATSLFNVQFLSALSLSSERPMQLSLTLSGSYWCVRQKQPEQSSSFLEEKWPKSILSPRVFADGYLSFEEPDQQRVSLDFSDIRNRCKIYVNAEGFYRSISPHLIYGPVFQRVTDLWYSYDEALVAIRGLDEELKDDGDYILHPTILDAAFHITQFRPFTGDFDDNVFFLPSRIGSVVLNDLRKARFFPDRIYAYCRFKEWSLSTIKYDITLLDDTGFRLCTLESFEISKHYKVPYPDLTLPFTLENEPISNTLMNVDDNQITLASNSSSLFNKDTSTIFFFRLNCEIELQKLLHHSVAETNFDLWILAQEGPDANAAIGFVRALSREFLAHNIHLLIFPTSLDESTRRRILEHLPGSLSDEPDIYITVNGDITVPRMIRFPELPTERPALSSVRFTTTPKDHIIVRLLNYSPQGTIFSFSALVVSDESEEFPNGSTVVGLLDYEPSEDVLALHISLLQILPEGDAHTSLLALLGGFVVGISVAPSKTFKRLDIMKSYNILLTHCESGIGLGVSRLYAARGIKIVEVSSDISLLDLSRLGYGVFDVIMSGYDDQSFMDVIKTLLHPTKGRSFFWNDENNGLADIISKDPWFIGDALCESVQFMIEQYQETQPSLDVRRFTSQKSLASGMLFDSRKSYILLGGIGSLGAQVAVWMYEKGARHLILTSRSGVASLNKAGSSLTRRIISYLRKRSDLQLKLERCDATDQEQMSNLMHSVIPRIGGCMILTAATVDKSFLYLRQEDFNRVHASKIDVFNVLKDVVDISLLDFLVVFSSMAGLLGNGGQTNYGSAITALDGAVANLKNAFSFVCPPVIGTTMLWDEKENKIGFAVNHLTKWAMSSEETLRWLGDAIFRMQCGQSFALYIPDMDWDNVNRHHPVPKLGRHLLSAPSASEEVSMDKSESLFNIVLRHLDVSEQEFSPEVPFISYGLDSLSASNLSFALRSVINLSQIQMLSYKMTFEYLQSQIAIYPTLTNGDSASQSDVLVVEQMSRAVLEFEQEMRSYASQLSHNTFSRLVPPHVVILTGSTGALGPNILQNLIISPDINLVYVFNRASLSRNARDRQAAAFEQQGLPPDYADSPKIVYVECDYFLSSLGIPDDIMEKISFSVTHIIHNAWNIDFYAPYNTFHGLINGTKELLKLALRSKLLSPPHFILMSTTGVCRTTTGHVQVSEEHVSEPSLLEPSGYLQSKWVAEQMLRCARTHNLQTTVIRLGQLTGSVNGAWDSTQWFPSLVKSALFVGCLPAGEDTISWLPINVAAAVIVELRESLDAVVHVLHPRPVKWNTVMRTIADRLKVTLFPYPEWFRLLENNFRVQSAPPGNNPARKLLDFFRRGLDYSEEVDSSTESMHLLAKVSSIKAQNASAILKDEKLRQIDVEEVEVWLKYWWSIGALE